ncbi:uncharacterized protein EDB93DRAFT_1101058 [Suillus bovinus]|uniref:uncharacterized protein n=1 Tax=Suillus bovinus TaxID=48563 RepID=UPI001B8863CB|nr:uncharacterized protein EDB93DRAFT_1101058 [Suillus bovinus]KAG2157733.1 hypothetical protein EDB93DRAFT_1101058 [Suillus bovinus]
MAAVTIDGFTNDVFDDSRFKKHKKGVMEAWMMIEVAVSQGFGAIYIVGATVTHPVVNCVFADAVKVECSLHMQCVVSILAPIYFQQATDDNLSSSATPSETLVSNPSKSTTIPKAKLQDAAKPVHNSSYCQDVKA